MYNLGKQGTGTNVCGKIVNKTKIIPAYSCKCYWNGSKCGLNYKVLDAVHGGNPEFFECIKYFEVGDCVAGSQQVSWTTEIGDKSTVYDSLEADRTASGCREGSQANNCGEAVVKLPGFSLINIILVVIALGVFYAFFRRN
jgi:hypothetical protein